MKKVLFFMLLLVIGLSAMAQQKIKLNSADKAECVSSDMKSLQASFSFSTIEAEDYKSDQGIFSWLSIPNTVLGGNVGDPQIPVINELIAVPFGATPRIEITSYSTTDYYLADYDMKTLVPRQLPVRKNQNLEDVPFVKNEAAYQTRGLCSEPQAVVEVEGIMRGVRLGNMTIEPVCYDPVNNIIRVFNDIKVTVHFEGADIRATEDMLLKTYSPAFEPVYERLFNNNVIKNAYTDHPDLYNTPVRILVICYSGFRGNEALNNWLQWKLQKGYAVDIFYTSETGTTASAIASFIKTKYNASVAAGNAYTYLIVIGDTGQVPYYMVKNIDSSIGNCASDLGYASVNFSTSTSNYFPDMYYSRMSVENTTHLTNYINKVLTYEKYEFADGGNYLNNVLLVGGYDANWTSRVAKPTINYGSNNYFNTSNTTYGGFNGGTIHAVISTSSSQGYSGSNNGVYNGINDGACLVNYTAHGDKQEWQVPQFTAAQVATLTNTGKYFFGIGNCCLTGNFNNTTTSYSPGSAIGANASFGETMIRVPNAGAIAYIGCSPYSYWYEDFYWAVGAHSYSQGNAPSVSSSSVGVYDAMFNDANWNSASALLYLGNLAVQQAVSNGNTNSSVTDGNCNNSAHYYFQFYHTFGDGSIMPYITKPEANTVTIPSTVTPGTSSIIVNAVAGSYVAVTDNSSVIYGVGVANSSGMATVNFTNAIPGSGNLYVVVTRQQYQPYFGTIQIVGGTQYNISANVNPAAAGTVSGTGTFYENTQHQLTAIANSGYGFTNWTLNGTEVSSSPAYTFTVTGNATYTANFHALQLHSITYEPQQTHGSISVSPTNAYAGDIVTLTATPDEGYVLDYWDVSTATRGNVTVTNNRFTMPDQEVTVSAYFRTARVAGDYELVTAAETDWSGEYVIAYVASSTSARVLTGKASGGNYGAYTNATIDNDVLAAADVASYKVTIEQVTYNNNTYYTIKQGSNYLALTSNGNYLYFATSIPNQNKTRYYWTIAYSGSTLTITNASYTSRRIQWNDASNSYRFACYTGTQQEIALFKKIENNCATPEALAVVNNSITTNGATVSWTGSSDSYKVQYAENNAGSIQDVTILSEGFEGNSLPSGWNNSTYTGNQWIIGTGTGHSSSSITATTTAATGNYNIRYYSSTASNNAYLITPVMNLANASEATLSFNYANPAWAGGYYALTIYYRVNEGAWTQLAQYTSSQDSWTGKTVPLTGLDDNYQIGFYVTGYNSDYGHGVGIDDIAVTAKVFNGSWTTASGNATSPYTLSNLDPETSYLVRVIGVCEGMESDPSQTISFTTETACPAPTSLTATNVTPSSANMNWESEAGSYNVRYRKVLAESQVFFEGFESGIGSWTTVASSYSSTSTDWRQFNATNFVDDDGNPTETNHTGDYVAMSRSYGGSSIGDQTVDNWLISPQITLDGVLRYWVINNDGANYVEYYDLYVSTTGNSISDFTLFYEPNDNATEWTEKVVDLSSFNGASGYIAFRNHDTGKDFILIDDISINAVTYSEWTTVTANDNAISLTGLESETTYQVQVQADCGSENGTSSWSSSARFTTLSTCATPDELNATDIMASTTTLNWTGYQDSYNVRYKTVYFEGFEDGIPSVWTTIDNDGDGNNWLALSEIPSTYSAYSVVPGWAHSGSNAACSPSYVNTGSSSGTAFSSDQWLISPQLDLQGLLKFYITSTYADEYEVKLSTTGTSVSDFNITLQSMTAASTTWDEIIINLSEYAGQQGYIAIHHVFSDGYFLIVDDFSISEDSWHTATASQNTLSVSGLAPNTTYEWQVQGVNCDGNGSVTDWSESAFFETAEDLCKITVADLPYTEDFEDFTNITNVNKTGIMPDCWTLAYEQYAPMADTAKPQIFYGDNRPHTGDYCLYMFGMGILAMPELGEDVDITTLKMGFWLRQHKFITQLQVGVMSDLSDESTFTPLGTYDNGSSTEAHHYVVDFSQYTGTDNPKYIAFRNIVAPGYTQTRSVQFIDDISIYVAGSEDDPDHGLICNGIEELSYTENFDGVAIGGQPDCWTWTGETESATPARVISDASAQSGGYSLYMSGKGYAVMPELNVSGIGVTDVELSFYVRQIKYAHRLEVGVLEDDGTFTLVETIYNGGNYSTPVQHVVNFSSYHGEGNRIAFHNIAINTNSVSYNWIDDIMIYEPVSPNCDGITELSYTENFDGVAVGGQPDCWTWTGETESATPAQVIIDANAQSGGYSLYMSGKGYAVMPELNVSGIGVTDVELSFYVKQSKYAHRLEVGVLEDDGTFTLVETIYNGGNYSTPVQHVVDFSSYTGTGNRIAFHNIAINTSSVSYNWIDDITIYVPESQSCAGITELSYTENFDGAAVGGQPDCWTWTGETESATPAQVIIDANAQSGGYSLYMSGKGYAVMPELNVLGIGVTDVELSFYVRQKKYAHRIVVGVMTDPNDPETFTEVADIYNGGNYTTPVQHVVDFTSYEGEGKYIAFHNIAINTNNVSYNYLDDITLSVISNDNTGDETEMAQNQSANTEDTEFDNNNANNEEPFNAPNAISNINAAQLSLYPNPTSGKVTLVADEVTMVEVYSQIGSKVASFTMNNERVIDLGNLPKGVYILRVTMPQGVAIRKVVKN